MAIFNRYGSSKFFEIETSSLNIFLLLVLIKNSLARYLIGLVSNGLNKMELSRVSPGTMDQMMYGG
jgi:hypothetical protein